jgi:hypothetical protein
VRYDPDQDGDYPAIGNEPGCALPLLLQASCSAAATTVTVQLLPMPASGANPRRDEHLLRNWTGGLVEARDDRLLLVILKLASDGQIEADGTVECAEILSVSGPATIVSADTFTIPVLRGRKGMPARAFDAGAWTDVEAWLVPTGSLQAQRHSDWIAAATAGATIWFRFRPYALGVEYFGAPAYAERLRRAAASEALEEYSAQPDATDAPTVPYRIPAGYLPAPDDQVPGTLDDLNWDGTSVSSPVGDVQVQIRGGDWAAKGFAPNPYNSAPVLPLYRLATISGSPVGIELTGAIEKAYTVSHAGQSSVAVDGTVTNGIVRQWTGSDGSGGPETVDRMTTYGPGSSAFQWYCFAASATVRQLKPRRPLLDWEGAPVIAPSADDGVSGWVIDGDPADTNVSGSGVTVETLSQPDGKPEAIARLLASAEWGDATSVSAIDTVPLTVTTGKHRVYRYRPRHTVDGADVATFTGLYAHARYHLKLTITTTPVDELGVATDDPVESTEYGPVFTTDLNGEGGHDWIELEAPAGHSLSFSATLEEI